METDFISAIIDLKLYIENGKNQLSKEKCQQILEYIDYLFKKLKNEESINSRLNYKLQTLKESFKYLIDRV